MGEVLAWEGARALGVNSVARRAGVDKALIYRYFGDFDGLLEEFASSGAFWPAFEELLGDRAELLALPFADRLAAVMKRYASALRKRPATIAILGAEMLERTAVHPPLEAAREKFGLEMLSLAGDTPPRLDLPAVVTVLTGAIHYLLVRSAYIKVFNGIPIATDQGWERIEGAVDSMARAVAARRAPRSSSRQPSQQP